MRWLVLLISILPFTLSAQVADSVSVTFIIQDSISSEPVFSASIKVDDKLIGQSDLDGVARFVLPKGEYYFEVSYIGYKSFQNRLTIDADLELLALLTDSIILQNRDMVVISTGGPRMTREMMIFADTLSISIRELKKLNNFDTCIEIIHGP